MEDRLAVILQKLPPWAKPALVSACIFLLIIIIVIAGRSAPGPGEVVEEYVDYLAAGDCRGAYGLVSDYAVTYYLEYGTFEKFRQNVCRTTIGKYDVMEVREIDRVVEGVDEAVVYFRLRFRASWMPLEQDRPMEFHLSRQGRRWRIDGPVFDL